MSSNFGRRPVLAGLGLALIGTQALAKGKKMEDQVPFGMIGKMKAQPGKRAELIAILGSGTGAMPGCRAYLIAEDAKDPDAIWITEIWDDAPSHKASLQLPAVRDAITRGRPLIAGFELSVETRPVEAASFWKRS
ncbi:putative quinol monooxygenase [Sphingomonas psychrotolerans]|uniref:Antibiotic biosynthesis monooxygenase n=1 Tax=Sphingomonas psychrotolerans TaxID=1327635 RepID=A0A2K8MEA3_9SPHN|nr:putative quinol monooxygenase [Sphingomonas psychrotolerans]ATY31294.1 antibiotic biosynthesis monooxygenase [Sphingomonas psychrotolerans]